MVRLLTPTARRLSLAVIAVIGAILVCSGVASAAQPAPRRATASTAVAAANAKAIKTARIRAIRHAENVATGKARRAARRKLEHGHRAAAKGARITLRVKVVRTKTKSRVSTQPVSVHKPTSSSTPAAATTTVATSTAQVTAAATSSVGNVSATATSVATATATSSAQTTIASSSGASSGVTSTGTSSVASSSAGSSPNSPSGIAGNWNLAMDSEFNTPTLNTNVWTPGWFNTGITDAVNGNENDCYDDNTNLALTGSALSLSVTHVSSTCNTKTATAGTYPYTGALISSNTNGTNQGFLYTYGVVQTRVYLPAAADGTIANWPAVFAVTTPNETYGEDDILEGALGQACYHYHNDSGAPGGCVNMTPGWHTLASDWEPGSITYYYDGVEVGSEPSTTTQPMYIVINNTTAKDQLAWTAAGTMQVQYVKVWQHSH